MKNSLNASQRNYGIDLLRIISMVMVIILHCFGRGGLLSNPLLTGTRYHFVWFLEILCYAAVDIFAIISGYVCYKESEYKIKVSNYIKLWLQVVFWGILLTLSFQLFSNYEVGILDYLKVLFPVSNNIYWYFTEYTALFFLMPFIIRGLQKTPNNVSKYLFWFICIFFSLYAHLFNLFNLNNGYSFAWLLILFIIGAILKKVNIGSKLKIWQCLIGVLVLTIITFLYKLYGFEFSLFVDIPINKDFFISYKSMTILGMAILYVLAFSKMKFNKCFNKLISFFAPSAFAIYLFNNNPFIWNYVMNERFSSLAETRVLLIASNVLIFTICFVLLALIIDKIRCYLFKLIKIDKFCSIIDEKTQKKLY